jgi:CYTH domain-containing protein
MEIERKFLVASVPAGAFESSRIRQGYVAIAPDGAEVRVRDRDGECSLTVKHGAGVVREEHETVISAELFDALWSVTEGRRVEKRRLLVPLEVGLVAEVDVFEGALSGLVVAEVEFPTLQDAERFAPPAWFGREVSEDARYKNQSLALRAGPVGAPDDGPLPAA